MVAQTFELVVDTRLTPIQSLVVDITGQTIVVVGQILVLHPLVADMILLKILLTIEAMEASWLVPCHHLLPILDRIPLEVLVILCGRVLLLKLRSLHLVT